MQYLRQTMPLLRLKKYMHVVGHDAPGEKKVTNLMKPGQGRLHKVGCFSISQYAGSLCCIKQSLQVLEVLLVLLIPLLLRLTDDVLR